MTNLIYLRCGYEQDVWEAVEEAIAGGDLPEGSGVKPFRDRAIEGEPTPDGAVGQVAICPNEAYWIFGPPNQLDW